MTPTSPRSPAADHRKRTGLLSHLRQLAWASVPVWSLTLFAWAPFLALALIRRQRRDWEVFAGYLAVVVMEMVLVSIAAHNGAATGGLILLVMGVASVHAFVAFRPGAALPSWREAHSIRAAARLPAQNEKLAASAAGQDEIRERTAAARAALADAEQARKRDQQARKRDIATAGADARQVRQRDKQAARAALAEAKEARKRDRQARKREIAAAMVAKKEERRIRRAAADAARRAEPRYGWVETRRTYRHKTIFGNRRSETIVGQPSQRNARRRTHQRGGVTITEEWRRLD